MENKFRPGEIMTLPEEKKKEYRKDQLEGEFTAGEIMPKDRYLGNKKSKKKEK